MKINKRFNKIWKEYVTCVTGSCSLNVKTYKPDYHTEAGTSKSFFEFLDDRGYLKAHKKTQAHK